MSFSFSYSEPMADGKATESTSVRQFFRTGFIWGELFAFEPLVVAVAALAMLLSWGWVLSDVDLFHLIWYDNAGAWYDNHGDLKTWTDAGTVKPHSQLWITRGLLFVSGLAACISWCIWVTIALVCLHNNRERRAQNSDQSTTRTGYSLIWLSLPALLSLIPAFYSNAPEYEDCVTPLENRWPFLLGACFGEHALERYHFGLLATFTPNYRVEIPALWAHLYKIYSGCCRLLPSFSRQRCSPT